MCSLWLRYFGTFLAIVRTIRIAHSSVYWLVFVLVLVSFPDLKKGDDIAFHDSSLSWSSNSLGTLLTNLYNIADMIYWWIVDIIIIICHFHWNLFLILCDIIRISWVWIFRYWTSVYCEITSDRLFLAAEHLLTIKNFQKSTQNWFFSEIILFKKINCFIRCTWSLK